MNDVGYILYIDEAGDDGIKLVERNNPKSATEWFLFAGILVRIENNARVRPWVNQILQSLNQPQLRSIHYTSLAPHKRAAVSKQLASLNIRCFLTVSNKLNMNGYQNPRAAKIRSNSYFYCWMARILLESVSDFCQRDSLQRHGRIKKLRIEFSRRGRVSYPQLKAYLYKLKFQSRGKSLFIDTRDIKWDVIDFNEIHNFDNATRPGLQLADIAAGTFYQSLGDPIRNIQADPESGISLKPILAKSKHGKYFDYSVKLLPNINTLSLTPEQQKVFDFYMK